MHHSLRRAAITAAVLHGFTGNALAADYDDAVIVTASRFPVSQRELPVSVTTIGSAEIARSTAKTLPELLGQQTGFVVRNNTGSPNQQVDLRGFGMTGDQNTLVLIDGQRISENELSPARLAAIPLDSIERIEILRGSGAVLYGGGATAGTINIITRQAGRGDRFAAISLSAGNHGMIEESARFALGGEQAAASLSANHLDTNNYRANNALVQDTVAGDLRYFLPQGDIYVKFGSDRQYLRLPGSRTEAQLASDRRGTSTPDDNLHDESWFVTLGGSWRSGDTELAADLRQRDRRAPFVLVFGGSAFTGERSGRQLALTPRARFRQPLFGLRNSLVIGVDATDADLNARDNFGSDNDFDERHTAVYFHDSLSLSEQTRLTFGARHERIRQSLEDRAFAPGMEQEQTLSLNANEVGVHHRLDRDWSLFAKTGRSFRVANIDENLFQPKLLKPQTSRDREAGVEWRHGEHSARASAFRNDLDDEIHFNRLVGFFGANVNLPPTRRQGVEVEAGTGFGDLVHVTLSYSLTEATFRDGNFGGVDVDGKDIPLVPRHVYAVKTDWNLGRDTTLAATVRRVGEQRYDNDQANTFAKMPAYTLLDLKLVQAVKDWRLALTVANALGEKYYSYGIRTTPTSNTFSAYPEAERTFLATVEYHFR